MFIFRCGQIVQKGTYWEPNKGRRVLLKDEGFLPGESKEWYYKLPESYLLIPMFLLALALSMALPYGVGAAIFLIVYALYRILFSICNKCERLLVDALSSIWFSYKPNVSFFSGRSKKWKRRERKEKGKDN
jgi:lipopolysaccharide export LptBFGC system permease protein LptF